MSVPLSQSHGGKLGDCATSEAEWRRTAAREVRRPDREVEAGRDLVVEVVGEVGQGERGEEGASVAVPWVGRRAEPKQRHRGSVETRFYFLAYNLQNPARSMSQSLRPQEKLIPGTFSDFNGKVLVVL